MATDTKQQMGDAFRAGDVATAERLAREALDQAPDDPTALQILGAIASARSDWPEAVARFARAAAVRPANPGARFNHAEALRKAGDRDGAIAGFEAVLAIAPDHVPALVTLARLLSAESRQDEAVRLLDRAVALAPRDARARIARGNARLALGRAEGLDDLHTACTLDPGSAAAHLALGRALAAAHQHDAADRALARAIAVEPRLAPAHRDRGKLAMLRHEPGSAVAHYRQALAYVPDDPETLALIAQALHELRRPAEAAQHLGTALQLQPANATARLLDAQIRRGAGDVEGAQQRLEVLVAERPDPELLSEALSELGHCLDRRGACAEAYAYFTEANALVARRVPRSDPVRAALPDRIAAMGRLDLAALSAGTADAPAGPRPAPVFIVGFPRSGTTLIEQVLASQGDFVTSDEAPLIGRLARQVGRDPAAIAALSDAALGDLRQAYWRAAEAGFPALNAGRRFVDKQPWNLIELPLIVRMFPQARILVVLRDPRDVCLSAFMQYFALDPATVHLLSLADAAATYARVMDLWLQWRDRLPAPGLEVRYEDLVRDFDGVARTILAFLDAPWRDAVRDFGATARNRAISTPSRDAVSGPLSDRSIGRWARYHDQMRDVLPVLAPFVARFGYDPIADPARR